MLEIQLGSAVRIAWAWDMAASTLGNPVDGEEGMERFGDILAIALFVGGLECSKKARNRCAGLPEMAICLVLFESVNVGRNKGRKISETVFLIVDRGSIKENNRTSSGRFVYSHCEHKEICSLGFARY